MTGPTARIGSLTWVNGTGGRLTPAERLILVRPLLVAHARILAGRTAAVLGMNSGRRATVPPAALRLPHSALTQAAEIEAQQRLSPALLNHSYRTYLFGAAIAHLEHVDVDRELLLAAALLHDTGLRPPTPDVDFTLASAKVAFDVAERVGLSTAATQVVRNAIALHHNPDVTLQADGPVAYLLSAGAAADVVGMRAWALPRGLLHQLAGDHPRLAFKREFASAVAAEAAAVPGGRMDLLRRYGAFDLAIRLAPFADSATRHNPAI